MLDNYDWAGYDLEHHDKEHKTIIRIGNRVIREKQYRNQESTSEEVGEETEGFFNQNIYKVVMTTTKWLRIDKTNYTESIRELVFDRKKERPSLPKAIKDCYCCNVHMYKWKGHIHRYDWLVPMSRGDVFPKTIIVGKKWVSEIGDSYPRWRVKRTGRDKTEPCQWGDTIWYKEHECEQPRQITLEW